MSHPFQFFPLSLVRPLLTEVLLCIDKAVVDDEVDVRVVRVEELNNVRQVRIVQEESEVLRRNTMITNKAIKTSSSSFKWVSAIPKIALLINSGSFMISFCVCTSSGLN